MTSVCAMSCFFKTRISSLSPTDYYCAPPYWSGHTSLIHRFALWYQKHCIKQVFGSYPYTVLPELENKVQQKVAATLTHLVT